MWYVGKHSSVLRNPKVYWCLTPCMPTSPVHQGNWLHPCCNSWRPNWRPSFTFPCILIKTNKLTFSDSRKSDKTTGCMRRPVLVCQWDKICLISWVVSYFINAEIVIASLTEWVLIANLMNSCLMCSLHYSSKNHKLTIYSPWQQTIWQNLTWNPKLTMIILISYSPPSK